MSYDNSEVKDQPALPSIPIPTFAVIEKLDFAKLNLDSLLPGHELKRPVF